MDDRIGTDPPPVATDTGGRPAGGRATAAHAVIAASVLVALVALSMRRSLAIVNADSLLHGLISTEQLTLFYWGQDRLANLLPLLAWPVQHLMWNYLLQTALIAASFHALLGCFVWFHATRSGRTVAWSTMLAAFAVAGGVAVLLLTRIGVAEFMLVQQHGVAALLYLVGMTWLMPGRSRWARAAGAGAILAATLVIPSVVLLTPFAAVVVRGRGVIGRLALAASVSFVAFVVGSIAARVGYDGDTSSEAYSDFALDRLGRGLDDVLVNLTDAIHAVPAVLIGVVSISVLVARRRTFDPTLRWAYLMTAPLAAGWVALFAANQWVEINQFSFRYFFPAYGAGFFVVTGAVTEAFGWAAERFRGGLDSDHVATSSPTRPNAVVLVAALSVVCAVVAVGAASRVSIASVEGGRADADVAEQFGADLMVGDYWTVWPAMFASRADGGDLLVVAERSDPLRDRIERVVAAEPTVVVVCTNVTEAECTGILAGFLGEPVRSVERLNEQPLVIRVATTA